MKNARKLIMLNFRAFASHQPLWILENTLFVIVCCLLFLFFYFHVRRTGRDRSSAIVRRTDGNITELHQLHVKKNEGEQKINSKDTNDEFIHSFRAVVKEIKKV